MGSFLSRVFDHPDLTDAGVIALKTLAVYAFLILGLRLSGRRELGQMTLYDVVTIIILGNAVQNAMLNSDNTLVGGLIAATVLLGANRLFGVIMRRSARIEHAMVGQPVLLASEGRALPHAMRHEGISMEQLLAALREHGIARVEDTKMCVLEADGTISVVPHTATVQRSKRHYRGMRLP